MILVGLCSSDDDEELDFDHGTDNEIHVLEEGEGVNDVSLTRPSK